MEERSSTGKKNKILRFNIEKNCPDKVSPDLQGDREREKEILCSLHGFYLHKRSSSHSRFL